MMTLNESEVYYLLDRMYLKLQAQQNIFDTYSPNVVAYLAIIICRLFSDTTVIAPLFRRRM